ncbi:BTB domain-containing protein, partial [Haematococcus lacustris]
EEGLLPLITPITVSFKCTLEAIGSYNSAYASATFAGASFMKPGDEAVSSIGISNFFKKIANPASIDCWRPYLNDGKLRLKLCVTGASV